MYPYSGSAFKSWVGVEGQNARMIIRWGAGDRERYRVYASELVKSDPDVIFAATTDAVIALQDASRSVPIVFAQSIDPIGAGLISAWRGQAAMLWFTIFDYSISAKWMELLKEIVPHTNRVAVLRDARNASGIGQFAAIQSVAPSGLELSAIGLRETSETERAIASFGRDPHGGLIVTASGFGANRPQWIATLAAQHNLPTVYPFRYFVSSGGLISYGPDFAKQFRQAAEYIDRILRGATPAELPVQAPTKYELVINLKTAKTLGLAIPAALLARADEVTE